MWVVRYVSINQYTREPIVCRQKVFQEFKDAMNFYKFKVFKQQWCSTDVTLHVESYWIGR